MNYIFLGLFIVATSIHLYGSWKQDKKMRAISKGFIIAFLTGFYIFSVPEINIYIILALAFSWIGDLLLIIPGTKSFTAGGISFMIGHAFFILSYIGVTDLSLVSPYLIVILGLVFLGVVTYIFYRLKPYLPKALFYPMALYLLINGAMNCFAIYRLISYAYLGSILTAIGALLFFLSDSSLFFVRFNKNSHLKTHFFVMLTYSLGEFLIILGMII